MYIARLLTTVENGGEYMPDGKWWLRMVEMCLMLVKSFHGENMGGYRGKWGNGGTTTMRNALYIHPLMFRPLR